MAKQSTSNKTSKSASNSRAGRVRNSKATNAMASFVHFIRTQGVVGLAVGLAIGTQAGLLVKDIVNSVITPIVDLLVGEDGLSGLTWYVEIGDRSALFDFGLLLNSLLVFVAVAAVVYFLITGLRLDKLDRPKS